MTTSPPFPWRRIQLAFVAVVMSFVAATTIADLSLAEVDRSASRIVSRSSPSIQHLASARAELRRIQLLAVDAAATPSDVERGGGWTRSSR